ncbi:MAG: prenyltransferase/squalene oxidase repeat-containing protein [Candidatus Aminicenantales bacterium]
MSSPLPFHLLGKWGQSVLVQIHKRNPLNLRPILGIPKDINPKAAGLLLSAYSILARRNGNRDAAKRADELFAWLLGKESRGFRGPCWGYNFTWASPEKILPRYHPSLVVTAFVMKGVFEYHRTTGSIEALKTLRNACSYILGDLPITESPAGLCFSYTDLRKDCCFNANMLAAEVLAKAFSLTGEEPMIAAAQKAVAFTLAHQKDDGRWNYSIHPDSGKEREQVDFHQGFILESLFEFHQYSKFDSERVLSALKKGAAFYLRNQFFDDGRSKWRYPREYPADIHHQAQGIITFRKLASMDPSMRGAAERIADWTIRNMRHPKGYFFYQRGRVLMNRISYMRWGQAWMFLALALVTAPEEK